MASKQLKLFCKISSKKMISFRGSNSCHCVQPTNVQVKMDQMCLTQTVLMIIRQVLFVFKSKSKIYICFKGGNMSYIELLCSILVTNDNMNKFDK